MTARWRPSPRTALATIAAAVLAGTIALTASGVLGGGAAAPTGTRADKPPSAQSADPGTGDARSGDSPAGKTGEAPAQRKVKGAPDPATGKSASTEKKYLAGQVPKGIEPRAILEAGNEACLQIDHLVSVDPDAAVYAIRSGEIKLAPRAVRHLCTEHLALLRKAGK